MFDHNDSAGNTVSGVFSAWAKFPLIVLITSVVWLVVTCLTQAETQETLIRFYKQTQPGGPGWKKIIHQAQVEGIELKEKTGKWSVPSGILAMILGCILVYGCMFATGNWIYGNYPLAIGLTIMTVLSGLLLLKIWNKMKNAIL